MSSEKKPFNRIRAYALMKSFLEDPYLLPQINKGSTASYAVKPSLMVPGAGIEPAQPLRTEGF